VSRIVLVHSPLVGPATWALVAEELERRGHTAIVPSLLEALKEGPDYCAGIVKSVSAAVERASADQPLVLIGHSAAGAYLPVIRQSLPNRVVAYVFVDARLPVRNASLFDASSEDMAGHQRALAKDGWLPPWSDWFGEEAVRQVIPDEEMRRRFLSELRPIPLRLFEETIPVFAGWPDAPCGYIQFSEVYEPEAEQARANGWPVIRVEGEHLHMLVAPDAAADAILALVAQLATARLLSQSPSLPP
jgi:Alpha/beta hydrolase family